MLQRKFEDYEQLSKELSETFGKMKELLNVVDRDYCQSQNQHDIETAILNNPLNDIKGKMLNGFAKIERDDFNSQTRGQQLSQNKYSSDNPYIKNASK